MVPVFLLSLFASASAAPRALIVAVSDYRVDVGWPSVNTARDAELLALALQARGVAPEAIEVLTGRGLTKERMLEALRTWRVDPGDDAYLHLSGHGQRISDVDGDEAVDGHDEAFAFLGTPANAARAGRRYRGDRHLTDDELAVAVDRLRARLGTRGSLAITLDVGFAGSRRSAAASRGHAPLAWRGRRRTVADEPGSGLSELVSLGADLAPVVVMSAAQPQDAAFEVRLPGGTSAGALSVALADVWTHAPAGLSWDAAYHQVLRLVRRRLQVDQIPQLEGDVTWSLFGPVGILQRSPPRPVRVAVELEGGGQRDAWRLAVDLHPDLMATEQTPDFVLVAHQGSPVLVSPDDVMVEAPWWPGTAAATPAGLVTYLEKVARTWQMEDRMASGDPRLTLSLVPAQRAGETCVPSPAAPGPYARFAAGDVGLLTVTVQGPPMPVGVVRTDGRGLSRQVLMDEDGAISLCLDVDWDPDHPRTRPSTETVRAMAATSGLGAYLSGERPSGDLEWPKFPAAAELTFLVDPPQGLEARP